MWFYVEEFKERRRRLILNEGRGHCRGEINMPARISPLGERERLVPSHRRILTWGIRGAVADTHVWLLV